MEPIVHLEQNEKNGFFKVTIDGTEQGRMTFVYAGPDKIIIDHTEVRPGNEGKGLGKKMVTAAVEMARTQGLKILPLCPFAKAVFDKTPEFNDVRV